MFRIVVSVALTTIVAVVFVVCGDVKSPNNTGMYRGNASRTGVYQAIPLRELTGVAWRIDTIARQYTSLTAVGGLVFIGGRDKSLHALDLHTGRERWRALTGVVDVAPAVAYGMVYVSTSDSSLYALDTASGEVVWRVDTPEWVFHPPAVTDSTEYIKCEFTPIALDAFTGATKWSRYGPGSNSNTSSPLTVDDSGIYYSDYNQVVSQDKFSGVQRWRRNVNSPQHGPRYTIAVDENRLFVCSDEEFLYALDASTGEEIWQFKAEEEFYATPAVYNGTVLVGDDDGIFYALDAQTGEEMWRKKVDVHMNCLPVVADGIVHFGTDDSDLVLALEVGTGTEVWRFESAGGTRSSPVIADKMLLIVDMDGSLYALH